MERTKKEQKAYNRAKGIEKLKRSWTLLKAKLLNTKISSEDSRTLQAHPDSQGISRDYYVSNPYLQGDASYAAVNAIIEDPINNRFVYRGLVLGADNAIGVIESNVPLSEIVASPDGNIKLQEMLSSSNAIAARNQYYDKIGENKEPLEKHTTFFGKPDFVLGTITKGRKEDYTFNSEISSEIEEQLHNEREEDKKAALLRNSNSVELDIGGGIVVARQDCWLEQENGIQFAGTNKDALLYKFSPGSPIQTDDKQYYVQVGKAQIGETKKSEVSSNGTISYIPPFKYKEVIVWTKAKNLIQYFLDKKGENLNFVLGDIFTSENIKKSIKNGEPTFIGGIVIDEEGKCKRSDEIPESVKETVKKHLTQEKDTPENNLVNFRDL